MTETQFTSKLVKELRLQLGPRAVIHKHADGFNAGIPDVSVSLCGATLWYEAKMTTNKKIFEPLQLAILKLHEGSYIIWNAKERNGYIVSATQAPTEDFGAVYNFKMLVEKIVENIREAGRYACLGY